MCWVSPRRAASAQCHNPALSFQMYVSEGGVSCTLTYLLYHGCGSLVLILLLLFKKLLFVYRQRERERGKHRLVVPLIGAFVG